MYHRRYTVYCILHIRTRKLEIYNAQFQRNVIIFWQKQRTRIHASTSNPSSINNKIVNGPSESSLLKNNSHTRPTLLFWNCFRGPAVCATLNIMRELAPHWKLIGDAIFIILKIVLWIFEMNRPSAVIAPIMNYCWNSNRSWWLCTFSWNPTWRGIWLREQRYLRPTTAIVLYINR